MIYKPKHKYVNYGAMHKTLDLGFKLRSLRKILMNVTVKMIVYVPVWMTILLQILFLSLNLLTECIACF